MRKPIIILFAGIMGLLSAAVPAQAADGIPDNCEYVNGAFYQPNLIPVYDTVQNRVLLIDWTTGADVKVLDEGLETAPDRYGRLPVQFLSWSPDCRYLAASIKTSLGKDLMVWDVISGTRQHHFETVMYGVWPSIDWEPGVRFAVVTTRDGALLWNIAADSVIRLTDGHDGYGRNFHHLQWDMNRMWVWIVRVDADLMHGVTAYDLYTGQQTAYFPNQSPGGSRPDDFFLSDDGSKLVVYTVSTAPGSAGATVWDIESGANWHIPSGDEFANWIGRAALSPDNRYLAVGMLAIRVWDLQNLGDGEPLYRHEGPDGSIVRLRFIDAATLETLDTQGFILRWDLHSGQFLNAYDQPRDRIVKDFALE
jgi:WD40 repeat protein